MQRILRQYPLLMILGWTLLLVLVNPLDSLRADDFPLKVRLEDDHRQPVEGVKLWVVTASLTGKNFPDELSHGISGKEGRVNVKITDRWLMTAPALRQEVALIAYKPGYCITALAIWRDSPLQSAELVLTLPKSVTTAIQVRSPDNQPVAKAKIEIGGLAVGVIQSTLDEKTAASYAEARGYQMQKTSWGYTVSQTPISLPAELQTAFTFQSDDQGNVKCVDLEAKSFCILSIDTVEFGKQIQFRNLFLDNDKIPRDTSWPETARLARTGHVSLEITEQPAKSVANRKFTLSTRPPNQAFSTQDLIVMGTAEVQADAQGRLDVPAMVPGDLHWQLIAIPDDTMVAEAPTFTGGPQVVAGKTTNTKIKVLRGVQLKGSVVDSVTGKPIVNAPVFAMAGFQSQQSFTDPQGRFQFLVAPGQVGVQPGTPPGYFPKSRDELAKSGLFVIPADQTEFAIPPLKLDPAVTCSGVVTDETGQPISGATVHVSWLGRNRRSETASWSQSVVKTNEKGEFQVPEVDPAKCLVWGEYKGAVSEHTISVTRQNFQALKMTLSPKHNVTFKGKLVDSEGQPIVRATLELVSSPPTSAIAAQAARDTPELMAYRESVVFQSGQDFQTDKKDSATSSRLEAIKIQADGTFQLPPVTPHKEYQLVINSPNCLSRTVPWKLPERSGVIELGEIALTLVGNLTGTIVDLNGKPVVNAKLTAITARDRRVSTSNDQGEFRFDSTAKNGFLIIQHPDFRCQGHLLNVLQKGIRLELVRHTEPLREPFRPRQTAISPEEQRKLAEQLLTPILDSKSKATNNDRIRALSARGSWDPLGTLELLETSSFKNAEMAGMVRRSIVATLAKDNFEAALELTEAAKDDNAHAMMLRALFAHAKIPAEKKKELLADAYVRVKGMKQPELRVCYQGFVAEYLWDMGETERATELLREGLDLARKLPTSEFGGYARGAFSEELSVLDLPAALDLIKDLKDNFEFDRHHGNIAHELAGRNPSEAQRVWGLIKPLDPNGDRFDAKCTAAIPVCYRMASVDLPRAIEIAKLLPDGFAQARCYGVMAEALVEKDRTAAAQMIENAFLALENRPAKPRERLSSPFSVGEIAGSLLPTIEKIDPQRIPESLWRCIALLEPISLDPQLIYWTTEEKVKLAMFIGTYDAPVAQTLLNWCEASGQTASINRTYLPALAVINPQAAVAFVEKSTDVSQSASNRVSLAKILASQGEARLRLLHRNASLWSIDAEDMDSE